MQAANCSKLMLEAYISISGGDGLNWVEIGTFVMLEDSSGLSGNVNAIWPSKYSASDIHNVMTYTHPPAITPSMHWCMHRWSSL